MQKLEQNQAPEVAKTVELLVIKNTYKKLIMSDPILKSDFHKLMKYVQDSEDSSLTHCEKIINHLHLIAEVAETAEDDQRMDDEGPMVCVASDVKTRKHLQEHIRLKRDMESYHVTYLSK
jgi:hypothetical protein